jgi:hypothetical protein
MGMTYRPSCSCPLVHHRPLHLQGFHLRHWHRSRAVPLDKLPLETEEAPDHAAHNLRRCHDSVEVAVEVRVEARVPERRRAKRVRNAKARQDEEEREVPGEILWKESDSPRESEQEVDGDSHEVPSCAAQ